MAVQTGRGQVTGIRQDAADALAVRLANFADTLAANGMRPKRVAYGPARAVGFGRRRSPKGFLLHASGQRMQMLMPGGRLWQYHERRNIEGIYYDAPVDHTRASHGSIPLAGGRFSYLGAVVGKYHFGYLETGDGEGFEIGAIVGQDGASPQYLTADQAFAKIIRSL